MRIAIIDSGVHASHPHVQGVAGGVGIDARGNAHDDFVDRLGHGTAVAAAIREKAPQAEILAVRIFERELTSTREALVAGIRWAIAQRCDLINLSLGTRNADHRDALEETVRGAVDAGAVIVAAVGWLPGDLRGTVGVHLDWAIDRDRLEVLVSGPGRLEVRASGYPRPIPGVPAERNLKGVSFAVANATGILSNTLGQNRALFNKTVLFAPKF